MYLLCDHSSPETRVFILVARVIVSNCILVTNDSRLHARAPREYEHAFLGYYMDKPYMLFFTLV